MANPEHLGILKEGVAALNEWREHHPDARPDFWGANLGGEDLFGADLHGSILCGANLYRCRLRAANLVAADLSAASLGWADLSRADLSDADLSDADLSGADIIGAKLDRTNLAWAKVGLTTFANVNLSSARGLETLRHRGPSSVGIDTLYLSKGNIPDVFLHGAAVPDTLIKYVASLIGPGVEFYSLFISYSTHDQEFAERIYADLQAKGVRCWFAPHDMRSGKTVHEQIDLAIHLQDRLLLILSPASMRSSWVKREIFKAHNREATENRRVLYPISLCPFEALRGWECLDADTGMDLAREIREYFIPDFSNWKSPDAYRIALDRLLADLHGRPDSVFTDPL
ncbi:MAG TPA: toll/interleukin-1 receptor domain-containing protein [Terracidiphilus sp.]|nr:toll/interleukin-1 receptor domain-containing protein [Terracidiphilus sp.]